MNAKIHVNAPWVVTLAPHTQRALFAYLEHCKDEVDVGSVIGRAVDDWLTRASYSEPGRSSGYGYQWKWLFLPETTRLLVRDPHGAAVYASVVGDAIVYEGRAQSPRQLVQAIRGHCRNAWQEILLRLPGEAAWRSASVRRAERQRLAEGRSTPTDRLPLLTSAPAIVAELTTVLRQCQQLQRMSQVQAERRKVQGRRHLDREVFDDGIA